MRRRSGWSTRGTSLPELIVTVGIISVVLGGSVLGLNRTYLDLGSAAQDFMNDVRETRMKAVTRGSHYKISWSSGAYTIRKLQDNDGNGIWATDDTVVAEVHSLTAGVTMTTLSGPTTVEFDTRGVLVKPTTGTLTVTKVKMVEVQASNRGAGPKTIEIWPSGQIDLIR